MNFQSKFWHFPWRQRPRVRIREEYFDIRHLRFDHFCPLFDTWATSAITKFWLRHCTVVHFAPEHLLFACLVSRNWNDVQDWFNYFRCSFSSVCRPKFVVLSLTKSFRSQLCWIHWSYCCTHIVVTKMQPRESRFWQYMVFGGGLVLYLRQLSFLFRNIFTTAPTPYLLTYLSTSA